MNDERDEALIAFLTKAGIDPGAIEMAMGVDALFQQWRRRVSRRELGLAALADLGIDLDMAQFDVLVAIEAPRNEFGPGGEDEAMIATVAERLNIDPSRASRLVAEMVEAGYALRSVSQRDARRTIVKLTPAGAAIVAAVRAYKFLLLADTLSDWSAEERRRFVPMLLRFSAWPEGFSERKAKFSDEIGTLSDKVARARRRRIRAARPA